MLVNQILVKTNDNTQNVMAPTVAEADEILAKFGYVESEPAVASGNSFDPADAELVEA